MQYLTQWRMQLAANMLRTTQASVAAVGARVGYDSEAAFARAFKRVVGAPPAAWRRAEAERSLGSAARSATAVTTREEGDRDVAARLSS